MKTLVLANHQAAVGKSTVSAMLVHHLARQGRRVLAIDLDHPGALGRSWRRSEQVVAVPLVDDALRPEIAQTLASGQMPWAVSATAARAVWNEMRPSIETLSAHLAADRAGAEVRP